MIKNYKNIIKNGQLISFIKNTKENEQKLQQDGFSLPTEAHKIGEKRFLKYQLIYPCQDGMIRAKTKNEWNLPVIERIE